MITFKLYLLFYLPWLAKSCIYRSRILKSNKKASKFSVFMCSSRLLKVIIWVFWIQCSHSWEWILLEYLKSEVSKDALMHSQNFWKSIQKFLHKFWHICVCMRGIYTHIQMHICLWWHRCVDQQWMQRDPVNCCP